MFTYTEKIIATETSWTVGVVADRLPLRFLPGMQPLLFVFLLPLVQSGAVDETLGRAVEDAIPIIELRGEGKPMTAAQIRHLEEMSNGGKPLDIKMDRTFVPANCPHPASRKDFVTFHYKLFVEDGRKIHQTYGSDPVRIQLGVGMTLPGLDKGLVGVCKEELRKIQIPYRLAQRGKSKVWKHVPTDEHWISVAVDIVDVEPYSPQLMFSFLDMNNDTRLDKEELLAWSKKMKDYGKSWKNKDIDNTLAVEYYIKYFDLNKDGIVSQQEWDSVMSRDEMTMESKKETKAKKGRLRDPGLAWILDFDQDGVVTYEENDEAAEKIEELLKETKRDEL